MFPKQAGKVLPTHPANAKFARKTLEASPPVDSADEWISPYSFEFGAILCRMLMEHLLGAERELWGRVIMVGHSLGGIVASHTIVQYPDIADALVLLDAALFVTVPTGFLPSLFFSIIGKLIVRYIIPRTTPGEMAFISMDCLSGEQIEMYRRIFKCEGWEESLIEFGKYNFQCAVPSIQLIDNIQIPST